MPAVAIQNVVADFDRVKTTLKVFGIGATQMLAFDSARWMVMFQCTAGAQVAIGTQAFTVVANGLILTPNAKPEIFNFRDHGVLVTSEWWAVTGGAAQVNIWEVFYKPKR